MAFFWAPSALQLCSAWWDPSLGYSFAHLTKYLWFIQNLANWATWEFCKRSLTFQAFKLNTRQNQWISKMNWSKRGWRLGCATGEMLDDRIYRSSWQISSICQLIKLKIEVNFKWSNVAIADLLFCNLQIIFNCTVWQCVRCIITCP